MRKIRSLTRAERLALVRVAPLLLLVRAALIMVPFRAVNRWARSVPRGGRSVGDGAGIETDLWAVRALGHRWFPRNPCLAEALTGLVLLRRRGLDPMMRIGVRRSADSQAPRAHAWLEWDGRVVLGGEDAPERYAALSAVGGVLPEHRAG